MNKAIDDLKVAHDTNSSVNSETLIPNKMLLYHGTDARIVSMPEEHRQSYLYDSDKVIDSLGPLFSQYIYNFAGLKDAIQDGCDNEFINDFFSTLRHINSKAKGTRLYRYDAFYVTNNYERAIGYARDAFAFGERGKMAFMLCKAFNSLNIKPMLSLDVSDSMSNIISFASDPARPVVFEFDNLEKDYLMEENGMTWNNIEEQLAIIPQLQLNFRYSKPLVLDLRKAYNINI